MSLTMFSDSVQYPITRTVFPAGETCLRVDSLPKDLQGSVDIVMRFEGNTDLFDLALLVDAVRRHCGGRYDLWINLVMPYLPYARQDRVCNPGESLSVKVVADFINSLKFDHVGVMDIHSEVGVALINNLIHADLCSLATPRLSNDRANTILVSPDAGANKKVFALAKAAGFSDVVRADKTRDVSTGKITGTVVYMTEPTTKDFLIIDDLIDGGKTFIELAKELRKLTTGRVELYVTHGIFSAGLEVFDGLIDAIYVANLMNPQYASHPLLRIL